MIDQCVVPEPKGTSSQPSDEYSNSSNSTPDNTAWHRIAVAAIRRVCTSTQNHRTVQQNSSTLSAKRPCTDLPRANEVAAPEPSNRRSFSA